MIDDEKNTDGGRKMLDDVRERERERKPSLICDYGPVRYYDYGNKQNKTHVSSSNASRACSVRWWKIR